MTPAPCPRPRRPRTTRLTPGLALLAAAGLVLAGCGGDDEDPFSAVDTSRRAATPAASATPSASATPTVDPENTAVPEDGATVPAEELAGRIRAAAAKKKSVSFDIVATGGSELGGTGKASGTGDAAQQQVTATMSGSRIEIVKSGGKVFLKSPSPIGGKPWLEITPNGDDPFSRVYTQVFSGISSAADVQATTRTIAKMGTFRNAGQEQIDGVAVTKYMAAPKASIGVTMLPAAYQSLGPDALKQAKTTVSLWVGADGLLHRTTVVFSLGGSQNAQTLVSYRGWGQPVSVTPPPASQVVSGRDVSNP